MLFDTLSETVEDPVAVGDNGAGDGEEIIHGRSNSDEDSLIAEPAFGELKGPPRSCWWH